MNKKKMMKLLRGRIDSCYIQLLSSRIGKHPELYVEGFRCRLDELLLFYHLVEGKTFMEVCEELGVKYSDVDIQDAKGDKSE